MRDFVTFLQMCASSGTLIASLCGLLIVPVAAWLSIRTMNPMLRSMNDDPAWQAPLASISGTLPGFVFLLLGTIGLLGAASSGCLAFYWGRILFVSILLLMIAAVARAIVIALERKRELDSLLAKSVDANEKLGTVAAQLGVRARILESDLPFCATTGIRSPVVLISSISLENLNATELEAALRHERAHAQRHDVLLATLLSFFVDLLPLPTADLIATYHRAREFAADACAGRNAHPEDLAGAIVALAGARRVCSAVPALAEDLATIKARVGAIFDPRPPAAIGHRALALVALAIIALLSLTPGAMTALNFYHCTTRGMQL